MLWLLPCNILGKVFHSLRLSTENVRRPHKFRWYDGTTSWWPAAERRWRLCTISETGTQSVAIDTEAQYRQESEESRWWLYTCWARQASTGRLSCINCVKRVVKLPSSSQNTCCCIHHTFEFVDDDLWSSEKNHITIVHTWRYTKAWTSVAADSALSISELLESMKGESRERGEVWGDDGDCSKVLSIVWATLLSSLNQVCTKVTLCLQFFTGPVRKLVRRHRSTQRSQISFR